MNAGALMVRGHDLGAPRADLRKRVKASLGKAAYWLTPGNSRRKPNGSLPAPSKHQLETA